MERYVLPLGESVLTRSLGRLNRRRRASVSLSFAKIASASKINNLRDFLRAAFGYEFDSCSTRGGSGSASSFACFDPATR